MGLHQSKRIAPAVSKNVLEAQVATLYENFCRDSPEKPFAASLSTPNNRSFVKQVVSLLHSVGGLQVDADIRDLANSLFDKQVLDPKEYTAVLLAFRIFLQDYWTDANADFKTHFKPFAGMLQDLSKIRSDQPGKEMYPSLQQAASVDSLGLPSPPKH